jgi:O-antigen/teichoic acid export membrane protein
MILPKNYNSGISIFPLMITSHILHGLASVVNIGIVITKKSYHNLYASTLGTVVNVVASFLLIPLFGILGASFGTFLSELIFVIYFIYFSNKLYPVKFSYKELIYPVVSFLFLSFFLNRISFLDINLIYILFIKLILFVIITYFYLKITFKQEYNRIVYLFMKRFKLINIHK